MQMNILLKLTRVHESIFALPWALCGALLPFASPLYEDARRVDLSLFCWIIVAFIAARTAAMSFNRLIDSKIDAANPRTKHRLLPSGQVRLIEVRAVAWGATLIFVGACALINTFCLALSPLVVFLLWAYSYTKRFTSLTHFVLGLVEFFAPFMAWVAVTGQFAWPPVFLGLAFLFSIAGMDILYQMMDREFDARYGLHNLPVALGPKRALAVARACHALAVLFLFDAAYWSEANSIFYLAAPFAAWVYWSHHRKVQTEEVPAVFFRCNSWVGMGVCALALGAVLCHAL